MAKRKVYWDTTCFIAYLSPAHPSEANRAVVCKDVLEHAQNDYLEIWTSVWTIVETIRPRIAKPLVKLPDWIKAFEAKDSKGVLLYPTAKDELERTWEYFVRNTAPPLKLSEDELKNVKALLEYPFIKKVQVVPFIAHKAAEIARQTGMKPADSIHVATAIWMNCDAIQCFDRDYSRVNHLIACEEPQMLSRQIPLSLKAP